MAGQMRVVLIICGAATDVLTLCRCPLAAFARNVSVGGPLRRYIAQAVGSVSATSSPQRPILLLEAIFALGVELRMRWYRYVAPVCACVACITRKQTIWDCRQVASDTSSK